MAQERVTRQSDLPIAPHVANSERLRRELVVALTQPMAAGREELKVLLTAALAAVDISGPQASGG